MGSLTLKEIQTVIGIRKIHGCFTIDVIRPNRVPVKGARVVKLSNYSDNTISVLCVDKGEDGYILATHNEIKSGNVEINPIPLVTL